MDLGSCFRSLDEGYVVHKYVTNYAVKYNLNVSSKIVSIQT